MGPTLQQLMLTITLTSLVTSISTQTLQANTGPNDVVQPTTMTLPAVRARITRRGLDYGAKVAVDMMMKNQHLMILPDELIPVTVGTSTMTVSNTIIRRFPRPLLKITPIPATTSGAVDRVQVNVTNCHPTVDATLKISQNWGLFTSERAVNVTSTLTNLEMSIEVAVDIDRFGRPLPTNIQCHADGEISFVLKGDFQRWTWLVNQVYNTMRRQFKEKIFEQVCSNTILEINKYVDNELKTVPMWAEIENGYKFDYRLTEKPKIVEHYLETSHKGTLSLLGDGNELDRRLLVPQIPPYNHTHHDRMAYLYVTDTVANSAWLAAMRNNQLEYSVNQNVSGLWSSVMRYLQTTCPGSICIGTIFPQLAQQYPNAAVTVDIYAVNTSYLPLQINGRSLVLRCKGIGDFYIDTPESRQKIFSISLTLAATVTLGISGNKLTFDIRSSSFRLDGDILSTPPGFAGIMPIAELLLDTYLTVISSFVLQTLQVVGRQGLPLFVPNVPELKFVSPVIINHNDPNILIIGTDVEYTAQRLNY